MLFKKYLKIYLKFWSLEIQKQLVYQPMMAFFSYLAHAAWIILSYVFLSVLTGDKVNSKTQLDLFLFLSYFHTVKSLFWIYASWGSAFLAGSGFREGKIDFLLLKPLPSQWLVTSFRPNIFALTDLLVGVCSFIYYSLRLNSLLPISMILFIVCSTLSALILYSVWISYLTIFVPSGKASAAHGLMNLLWIYGEYPNNIYHGFTAVITRVVFPTIIITTLPMSILLGQKNYLWIFMLAFIAGLGLIISQRFWQRMLRFYTSAS